MPVKYVKILYLEKTGIVRRRKILRKNKEKYARFTVTKAIANRLKQAAKRREKDTKKAIAASAAPPEPPATTTPPPPREAVDDLIPKIEVARRRKGATYFTTFKASGSDASFDITSKGGSPDLIKEDFDDEAAPRAFHSNQSGLLGRVKFDGEIPLESLLELLNDRLQFAGEERPGFDFREVYTYWSYKYQVLEKLGPTVRVIDFYADSNRRY